MGKKEFTRIRENLRLNKSQMAKLLKVTQPMVGYWEAGGRPIPAYIKQSLCFFLALSQGAQREFLDKVS